jgi:glycopeptide antibiotics resistance protein
VLVLFFTSNIGYLWYNVIGCGSVVIVAWIFQRTLFRNDSPPAAQT